MPAKAARADLRRLADAFLSVKTPDDLAALLNQKPLALHALALAPEYDVFHVSKKMASSGSSKTLEMPSKRRNGRSTDTFRRSIFSIKARRLTAS